MILVVPKLLRWIAGKHVAAMAVYPFILLRSHDSKGDDSLILHEKIHWRQQLELLIFPFYLLYGIFYLIGRIRGMSHDQAYRNIPFEREAYAHDKDLEYLSRRPLYAWMR